MKHLYIHWPFCESKCHFCDFVSFQNHDEFVNSYHQALCKEITRFCKDHDCNREPVQTLFLGGGTPSLYPKPLLQELFDLLHKNFDMTNMQEATIEVNPKGVTKEDLACWKRLGINRVSIGVQILADNILKDLHRKQTCKDVFDLIKIVPDYFDNVSVDLMLGLPGTDRDIWENTLKTVMSWPIQHVSIYLLMVYNKTPLFFKCKNSNMKVLHDSDVIDMYEWTVSCLQDCGFDQYEISNFAKKGFESKHNKAYWDRVAYKGFGLGASSFDGKARFVNENNLFYYIKHCNEQHGVPEGFREVLSPEQEFLEVLMLGLRQKKGVDLHDMLYFLKGEQKTDFLHGIKNLEQKSLIQNRGGRIYLTLKGMLLENEVILSLI